MCYYKHGSIFWICAVRSFSWRETQDAAGAAFSSGGETLFFLPVALLLEPAVGWGGDYFGFFRFEIKTDTKKTGDKISATKHVDYINREGKYKDIDQKDLEKMATENYITGPNILEHQPGAEIILYSSPFGVIKQDDQGIKVSRQASNQTIAIALLLAQKIYGENISLHGDDRFIDGCICVEHNMKLGLEFDSSLHDRQESRKELIADERRRFVESGGRILEYIRAGNGEEGGHSGIRKHISSKYISGRNTQPYPARSTIQETAQRGFCLPVLSGSNVDVSKQHSHVLLSKDEYDDLQRNFRGRCETYPKLRWNVSGIDGAIARATVDEITKNLQNHLDKTFAASHAQYINRESRFKQRGGCTKTGCHLPTWASGSAKIFFDAADKFEAQNGERYKEIVFSLPNELNTDQQEEILQRFLEKHLSDYYYAWAIHDKTGSMSNGERHTHVHIMFSTRKLDEYERTVGRTPELFFKRAVSAPDAPENGGCKKAAVWNGKERTRFVSVMRENLAIIQNEVLRKYGYDIKIDHRSLKARREEALAQGNMFLAKILDRVPESAIGPNALLDENSDKYQKQKKLRAYNLDKIKSEVVKNLLLCNIDLERIGVEALSNSDSLKEIEQELLPEEKEEFAPQLHKIQKLGSDIDSLQGTLITSSAAIEEAKLAYMSTLEKEQWQQFKHLGRELKNWQEFRKSILSQNMKKDAYDELLQNIKVEEADIRKKLLTMAPEIRKAYERLCDTSKQEGIQIKAGEKIFANSFTRKKIRTMLLEQKKLIADFSKLYQSKHRDDIEKGYTSETIVRSLASNLHQLYAQSKELREQIRELRPKVISPERALAMAKNNYISYIMKRQENVQFKNFAHLRKLKRELMKNNILSAEQQELMKSIEQYEKTWEALCSSPAAQKQINKIMTGILQKNSATVIKYAKLDTAYKAVQKKIETLKTSEKAVNGQSAGKRFKLTSPVSLSQDAPKIAAGIAGDVKFAPLVLRSKSEEYDDWELLTEAEKDEIREKKR